MILLELERVTKNFGSLCAVSNVSFQIEKDKVYSIIGPNGAGKTTLFNLITGHLKPSGGVIKFEDRRITKLKKNQISLEGIARSFQLNNLFPELTVEENIRLAVQSRYPAKYNIWKQVHTYKQINTKAKEIVDSIGLNDNASMKAKLLSHGDKRILEIGIALGTSPKLLLLDEPTSGMAPEETSNMVEFIKNISQYLTIIIIEHKMNIVMNISNEVIVLHQGQVIAKGNPEEVQNDNIVKEAYLGVCD